MNLEAFNSLTPLGLVALMVVLGYYAVQKLGTILTQHYERQQDTLNRLLVAMTACAERLDDIQESLQNTDRN